MLRVPLVVQLSARPVGFGRASQFIAIVITGLGSIGCQEKLMDLFASKETTQPSSTSNITTSTPPAGEDKSTQEAAKKEQEEKRLAEQEAAAALALETKERELSDCCLALAKSGFENRSMDYVKASELCDAAVLGKKQLKDVRAELEAALKKESLPPVCQAGSQDAVPAQ